MKYIPFPWQHTNSLHKNPYVHIKTLHIWQTVSVSTSQLSQLCNKWPQNLKNLEITKASFSSYDMPTMNSVEWKKKNLPY